MADAFPPECVHLTPSQTTLVTANQDDRELIYRIRHAVYAQELRQHNPDPAGRLTDACDHWNTYLVAKVANQISGFISITPPGQRSYSIDKYFSRDDLPFSTDSLYELRLLTVVPVHRRRLFATLLMYAAFRWVEAHGGEHIVAIGRREILPLYTRSGMELAGLSTQSGAVAYDLLHAPVAKLRAYVPKISKVLDRIQSKVDWQLHFPFRKPANCFHGGSFFQAVGDTFASLGKSRTVINADVLDAWFPPAPGVLTALHEHFPWLLRTSPPAASDGLIKTIANARGVAPSNILPGAGSSDLIFRALRHWLTHSSRVLILDPTYGEYSHVLEQVIGCSVDRLLLSPSNNYEVNLERLEALFTKNYDLVILVNPNSPTGRHIPRADIQTLLGAVPLHTRVWIDETYVDYVGSDQSLERFAVGTENVLVCKSMSKAYALSGVRVAYLCAAPHQLEGLRAITPPWVISLPAQVAAVNALQDPDYYTARYKETAELRAQLCQELELLGWQVTPGVANFLLCHLPAKGPDAVTMVRDCSAHGLFLRDVRSMGTELGPRALRIAVKDAVTNQRMLKIIKSLIRVPENSPMFRTPC